MEPGGGGGAGGEVKGDASSRRLPLDGGEVEVEVAAVTDLSVAPENKHTTTCLSPRPRLTRC